MSPWTRDKFLYSLLSTGFTAATAFLIMILGLRLAGTEVFGLFSLGSSVYFVALTIALFGQPGALVFYLTQSGEDEAARARYLGSAFSLGLLLAAVASLLLFLASGFLASLYRQPELASVLRAFACLLPLTVFTKNAAAVFQAAHRFGWTLASDVSRFLVLTAYLSWRLIGSGSAPLAASDLVVGLLMAEASAMVLLLVGSRLARESRVLRPRLLHVKELWSFGQTTLLTSVVNEAAYRIDLLMLGFFRPTSELGVYSAATSIVMGLQLLPSALQRVTYPATARDLKASPPESEARRALFVRLDRLLVRLAWGTTAIALGAVFWGEPILRELAVQKDLAGLSRLLALLAPGIVAFGLVSAVGTLPSLTIGKPRNSLYLSLTLLVANAGLNLLLIPSYGGSGAAVATSLAFLLVVAHFAYLCRRHVGYRFPWVWAFVAYAVTLVAGLGMTR